jgi:hypothetical protein
MTNEEHVDIKITRTGKRKTSSILDKILDINEERSFPTREDHDCMYEYDSERAFQYSLKRNPILERLERDEEPEPHREPFYSETLKPMLRDTTGAMEQRGRLRIRGYDRGDEIVWVFQIDRQRARFLDRVFSDFIAFLRRAFSAK